MRIAVVGGTGTLGTLVVRESMSRGHQVRVLSRQSSTFSVDLKTGRGLERAVKGCEAVVDASDGSAVPVRHAEETLVDGTRRLLDAGKTAGVRHHVCISIVGCEKVPVGYYGVKARQERLVRESTISWSVVRATQFHELLASAFSKTGRWGFLPSPKIQLQTVACIEVAATVADTVEHRFRGSEITIAGPEIIEMRQMARMWRSHTGRGAILLPIPLFWKTGRALIEGALTEPNPEVLGEISFEKWLCRRDP